jgi:hypothetical protein
MRNRRAALKKFYTDIFSKAEDRASLDRQEDARLGDTDELVNRHRLSQLADLVVEAAADPSVDRPRALHWLIHHPQGRMFAQQHKARNNTMTTLTAVVKQHGLEQFCKSVIADTGISGQITEKEFTDAVTDIAKERKTSFAALFSGQDDTGLLLRKAHNEIRNAGFTKSRGPEPSATPGTATLTPNVSGGAQAQDVDDATDAYAKLQELASRQGKSFAEVYQAPENQQWATLERRQARDRLMRTLPLMPK